MTGSFPSRMKSPTAGQSLSAAGTGASGAGDDRAKRARERYDTIMARDDRV